MSFLAPLFLLGALAVALPILFHLTRRSTRRKQTFSSLQFLQPTPPRLTRHSRIEHLLLLLLRGAVVALLAFAFARPFLLTPAATPTQSAPIQRWILLVDTSASMQRDSLWNLALTRVRQQLRDLTPVDDVALLTFDRSPRTLVHFDQWRQWNPADRAALTLDRLEKIAPGWAAAHLDLALIRAVELLEETDIRSDHAANRQIVLVSDLPVGARLDGIQGYDWPTDVHVSIESVAPDQPGNAGLHWIVDPNPHQPASSNNAAPRIRVTNSDDAQNELFQVAWANSPNTPPLQIHVPPGQSRVVHAPPPPENSTAGRLLLQGDPHPFDNTTHVLTPKPDEIQLLFVGPDPANDPRQLLFYLNRAFPPTTRQTVQIHTPATTTDPSPFDPRLTRLAIVTGPIPDTIAPALQQYLDAGGTALAVLRQHTAAQLLQSLFPDQAWPVEEAVVRDFALLTQIDFNHPLFVPFADPRYSDFTKIHFWKHRRLPLDPFPNARVVARFDTGDPALVELDRGNGRILVLTAGWDPADSQLALSSKFVPLLHALLDHAGGPQPPLPQYHVGDEILLPGAANPPFHVQLPDGNTHPLDPGVSRFNATLTPGIYTVRTGPRSWSFTVNVDPAESRTTPLPWDELERLGVPLQPPPVNPSTLATRERQVHRAELESRQRLWRWLILATLLVLLVESWLAGRLTRPPPAQESTPPSSA
jgi:hypothetical protein